MGGLLSYFFSPPHGGPGEEEEENDAAASLLDLLRSQNNGNNNEMDWNAIQARLASHPEEAAAFAHSLDPSPLQRALQQQQHPGMPLVVFEAFLEAYEPAVYCTTETGETVLHAAAQQHGHHAVEIVDRLLRAHPEAVHRATRDRGTLPLHYVRSSRPEVAERLLRAHPAAVLQRDRDGRLPLHYLCSGSDANEPHEGGDGEPNPQQGDEALDSESLRPADPKLVEVLLRAAKEQGLADGGAQIPDSKGKTPWVLLCETLTRALERADTQQQQQDDDEAEEKDDATSRLWQSLVLLAKAILEEPTSSFRMLRAVIALRCPPIIVKHALSLYPDQVYERDSKGRTTLMMAASLVPLTPTPVLCLLLQAHPAAARMTDDDGRLPIDILSAKHVMYEEELWQLVVQAEPRAVDTRDLRDKMFPFMTAALHSNDVNTIYCLLRAKPHVLRYFQWENDDSLT